MELLPIVFAVICMTGRLRDIHMLYLFPHQVYHGKHISDSSDQILKPTAKQSFYFINGVDVL